MSTPKEPVVPITFRCWSDKKDVTAPVLAALDNKINALNTTTIYVTCSAGHANVFGRPLPPAFPVSEAKSIDNDVVGRTPTPAEQLLITDAATLAPSSSLERYDKHATFIFSNVAILTTLVTAFELFKPEHLSPRILLPLGLAGLSLACAAFAITPKYGTVNLADLYELREHYIRVLRARGNAIRAAGILFALALLIAPFTVDVTAPTPLETTSASSFKITRSADGTTASMHVELANLPAHCSVQTVLRDATTATLAQYAAPASNTFKLDLEHPVPISGTFTVTTTVTTAHGTTAPGTSAPETTPVDTTAPSTAAASTKRHYEETSTITVPPPVEGETNGNQESKKAQAGQKK
jgi:hypothetical protein